MSRAASTGLLVALFAGIASLAGLAPPAFAAAPMAKTPAPGFYRFMLGDFEITALSDGTLDLPVDQILKGTTPAKINQLLAKAHLKSPTETSLNAYLINTGTKLILVDSGAGVLFGPTLGRLAANFKASGYQPGQVDEIYITHMHPDHVGGLVSDGKIVFPNAIVRAEKRESDFWLSQANLDKAPAEAKAFFQGAQSSLKPYVAAGKYKEFDGATELAPGIKSLPSKGHTTGHTTYVVESKGQKLVLIGDLVHVLAVQFDEPAVTIAFDNDPKEAQVSRKHAFTDAAKQGDLVGTGHLPFPGLGHVRANGKAFQWLPLNFTRLP